MAIIAHNLAAYEDFKRRLAALGQGKPLIDAAKRVGVAFVKQVADEFRESRDPYGKPWAPVFRNRRRDRVARARRAKAGKPALADKPLIDTGRLRASTVAIVNGTTVRVALPVEYASYHQYGTSRIKRRQILPESDTGGLGPRWTMALNKELSDVLVKHFGGK